MHTSSCFRVQFCPLRLRRSTQIIKRTRSNRQCYWKNLIWIRTFDSSGIMTPNSEQEHRKRRLIFFFTDKETLSLPNPVSLLLFQCKCYCNTYTHTHTSWFSSRCFHCSNNMCPHVHCNCLLPHTHTLTH